MTLTWVKKIPKPFTIIDDPYYHLITTLCYDLTKTSKITRRASSYYYLYYDCWPKKPTMNIRIGNLTNIIYLWSILTSLNVKVRQLNNGSGLFLVKHRNDIQWELHLHR